VDFETTNIAGVTVFYREAGDSSKPTLVLLHGFPSSLYTFHDLIPRLADRFRVIAPDYPGMGFSDAPAATVLRPTFDDVATAVDAFIAQRAGPDRSFSTCTIRWSDRDAHRGCPSRIGPWTRTRSRSRQVGTSCRGCR
jgi:pimeloyl-ACP methyl ester carboxylesterase